MSISDAVNSFYKHITQGGFPEWLTAIGGGSDSIIVYLKTKKHPPIPNEWEGVRVEVKFSGPMVMS